MTAALTLHVAGERYAIPVDRIGAVFRPGALTRVPLTAPEILGLANQRGKTLAIVHLARKFDAAAPPPARGALAVTIEAASSPYAVIVDAVGDVVEFEPGEAIAPPAGETRRGAPTTALFRRDGEVLALLDVERLFEPAGPPAGLSLIPPFPRSAP